MNIFLENWQFNHKLTPLHTYQAWMIAPTIWQNMNVSGTQKYQFSNSLVNWEKFGSTAWANIQKSYFSIIFINWKLWRPTREKLNSTFQYFIELGKRLKYSLRPKHKDSSFESNDNLKNCVRIWVSLLKIKGIYKAGHILNLMDEISKVLFSENE